MKKQTTESFTIQGKAELGIFNLASKENYSRSTVEPIKHFSIVDLWNIHRQHTTVLGRRKFLT